MNAASQDSTIVMSGGKRRSSDDDVIRAWPWFGGMPGKGAGWIFAL